MYILGYHGGAKDVTESNQNSWAQHDSCAALIDADGRIHAAAEEERFDRIKHSNFFPRHAIRYCLDGVGWDQVGHVAVPIAEEYCQHVVRLMALSDSSMETWSARDFIARPFQKAFGVDVSSRIVFCGHHESHAWSAWACSGFGDALVLVLDGNGDWDYSGLVGTVRAGKLTILKRFSAAQSVGTFYRNMIQLVGYQRFEEYKAMGLAPYGDPKVYESLFLQGVKLLDDGAFTIAPRSAWATILDGAGLLRHARRSGEKFSDLHKNFAAALQEATNRIVGHILKHYRRATGLRYLCVAGGVGHNCTTNGVVYYSKLFEDCFFQPAAHDGGLAVGSALAVFHKERVMPRGRRLSCMQLGPHIGSTDEIAARLADWGCCVSVEHRKDIERHTARIINDGFVVGWVQGRSEYGPRALGSRSILADPRPFQNRQRINEMIKTREGYRPFAPSVLEERVGDYFDVPRYNLSHRFMISTVMVKSEYRSLLGAITHVDGTARIQTVPQESGRYWSLIKEFETLSGVPILLNTSMNNHVEPIVDSVDDAVVCFLTTGLDFLVVGDFIAAKRRFANTVEFLRELRPGLPPHRFIQRRLTRQAQALTHACFVDTNGHHYMSQKPLEISDAMFGFLMRCDGHSNVGALCAEDKLDDSRECELTDELFMLWRERAVQLLPLPRA